MNFILRNAITHIRRFRYIINLKGIHIALTVAFCITFFWAQKKVKKLLKSMA